MTCSENTTNNRPVGIGYNSRNRPANLTELTTVSVSSVNAIQQVVSPSGYFTSISAVNYLGAVPGGVNALSSLVADVTISSPTVSSILQWTGNAWVNTSSPYVSITTNTSLSSLALSTNTSLSAVNTSLSSVNTSLSAVNTTLSSINSELDTTNSNLEAHIADTSVHWTLATLNDNYINASGDHSPSAFYFGGLSAAALSSITISAITLSCTNNVPVNAPTPTLAAHLTRKDYVDLKQPGDATLSAIAAQTTASNVLIYFSGVDLTASTLFTSAGRKFCQVTSTLAAGDIFYYTGSEIVKLAAPDDSTVLAFDAGVPIWVVPNPDSVTKNLVSDGPGSGPPYWKEP